MNLSLQPFPTSNLFIVSWNDFFTKCSMKIGKWVSFMHIAVSAKKHCSALWKSSMSAHMMLQTKEWSVWNRPCTAVQTQPSARRAGPPANCPTRPAPRPARWTLSGKGAHDSPGQKLCYCSHRLCSNTTVCYFWSTLESAAVLSNFQQSWNK